MKKYIWYGIFLSFIILAAQPVTAWHAPVSLSGPDEECSRCEFYSYTIHATSAKWDEHILRVNDTLPAGLDFIPGSSITEPVSGIDPQWDESTRTLTWDFYEVPANSYRNITFDVKPTGLTSVTNRAVTFVKAPAAVNRYNYWEKDNFGQDQFVLSNPVTTIFSDELCAGPKRDPVPAPEFPSIALPAALLVGMLCAVFIIHHSKEN